MLCDTFLMPNIYLPMATVENRKFVVRSKIFLFSKTVLDYGNLFAEICPCHAGSWAGNALSLYRNTTISMAGTVHQLRNALMVYFYIFSSFFLSLKKTFVFWSRSGISFGENWIALFVSFLDVKQSMFTLLRSTSGVLGDHDINIMIGVIYLPIVLVVC